MPTPEKGETEKDFIARCIPYVIKEEGIEQDHAVAKCYGIWRQDKKSEEIVKRIDWLLNEDEKTPAEKKAAVEEYGDVDYADEKNKRYPIDTEKHIRAAWNYVNMPKNSAKLDNPSAVKAKIIKAWKEKIDKDGPPSVEEK